MASKVKVLIKKNVANIVTAVYSCLYMWNNKFLTYFVCKLEYKLSYQLISIAPLTNINNKQNCKKWCKYDKNRKITKCILIDYFN